ncbi:protein SHORT HYPOCOTYL IN WHITE LIGHT 1 isoform X1 [Pyrus x bretschneideri]|uniref:protein SHORT HYPOCOTYL IN WHITE LIGHT 1 isoform X1 n=1 Tax=Pyrus x bretschneideri TaxID=225117 RepID=UPI00202E7355|nr:protein SHORT HYPOCOTYL IN WHITE LIGHT 1 isoform X1 [Pyrus x bretschneideri]
MPLSATLSSPSLSYFPQAHHHHQQQLHLPHTLNPYLKPKTLTLQFQCPQASRRPPNYPQGGSADSLADDPRNWGRSINSEVDRRYDFEDDDDDNEDEEDDEEEDRSLDLLVRFVQNVFKKVSRRARRAVRSVLPVSIPTNLVGFSVNGVLMLAFLWVLKAFLEVVCTLGSLVFLSILLIRGIWTGVAYYQDNRNQKYRNFEDDNRPWAGAQPVT